MTRDEEINEFMQKAFDEMVDTIAKRLEELLEIYSKEEQDE